MKKEVISKIARDLDYILSLAIEKNIDIDGLQETKNLLQSIIDNDNNGIPKNAIVINRDKVIEYIDNDCVVYKLNDKYLALPKKLGNATIKIYYRRIK